MARDDEQIFGFHDYNNKDDHFKTEYSVPNAQAGFLDNALLDNSLDYLDENIW